MKLAKTIRLNFDKTDTLVLIDEKFRFFTRFVSGRPIIITDDNVNRIWGKNWEGYPVIEIKSGEKSKNVETVVEIYRQLLHYHVDRSWFIVGIGGGVVCDITGFVAGTFLRGLRFGFIPTTLLAQCDAAIGGKNGVNFEGHKNIIGTFNQPVFILCDPVFLTSLPKDETANGFAEIVKHALIADDSLFSLIEQHVSDICTLQPDIISALTMKSINIKTTVVMADEHDLGERRKLNFGHTFGHAIESVTGLSHGKAISIGMMLAMEISIRKGFLKNDTFLRIKSLLMQLGLPVSLKTDHSKIKEAIIKDKKRQEQKIHFVLLSGIGRAIIEQFSLEEMNRFLDQSTII